MRSEPGTITVIISFVLPPHHGEEWLSAWEQIAQMARESAACEHVHIGRDHNDPSRGAMVSEWDTVAAFNRFARESRLVWIERSLGDSFQPVTYTILESSGRGVGGENVNLVGAAVSR